MAVAIIGPKFYAWDSDTGKPLAFGKVYTYQAGTNTPKATFTSESGETENANPVVLNGSGYAAIYLSGSYKIVVEDADGVQVWSQDPVSDPSQLQQEWVRQRSISQVDSTTFTVDGEFTDEYVEGVAVRIKQDSGFIIGTVASATYAGGLTTVKLDFSGTETISPSAVYAERAIVSFESLPKHLGDRTIYVGSVSEDFYQKSATSGQQFSAASWHPGGNAQSKPLGGGNFTYKSDVLKSEHNGGTIISPTVPAVSSQSGTELGDKVANFLSGAGETDGSGSGCFVLNYNGVLHPEQFGWLGDYEPGTDTGFDNTASIQALIDYVSPYIWQGNQADTRDSIGKVKAKILGGTGKARITAPIKINPFMVWEGFKPGGFFGYNEGSQIVACFTDKSLYAFDTAPMEGTTGNRPLGGDYTQSDFDGGGFTPTPGWSLKHLGISVGPGYTLKGIINRQIAQQSFITQCRIGGGGSNNYEGIKTATCWGGAVRDNHILATAYPLINYRSTTNDYQANNYLTVTGTKPTTADYTYVPWPNTFNTDTQDYTACVVNRFANINQVGNICEGGQIGIQTFDDSTLHEIFNYYEAISDFVYVCHSVNMDVKPSWIDCSSADLFNVDGSSTQRMVIDLTATAYRVFKGLGEKTSFTTRPIVYDQGNVFAKDFSSDIVYGALLERDEINIYASSSGVDTNSGYLSGNPVLTLQGALDRCLPGKNNVINFASGETITTKYEVQEGNVTNSNFRNYDIKINGNGGVISVGNSSSETHCIAGSNTNIYMDDLTIDLTNSGGFDYRSFLRSKGKMNVTLNGCSVTGGTGWLIGTQYLRSGEMVFTSHSLTLGSGVSLTHQAGSSDFVWKEVSSNLTNNGATVGNATAGRLFSSTFPA